MAEEIRKIISVDVSGAVSSMSSLKEETEEVGYGFKSLGEAKKYIDSLKASLIDLDEDSSEYLDTVLEINKVQAKLNEAMKASGDSAKDAEGSYNSLSKQMSELKKAWKSTNDEAERESIGKQIVTINDKLKDMDASIGNYQRNVGNYEGAFTKGLKDITDRITALGNPLAIAKKGVSALSTAFKALIANPVGAVIMAIVAAVKLLKSGFEGSEKATDSLKRAFSAFQPVINVFKNAITGIAETIGNLAEKVIPALVNGVQTAGVKIAELLNKIGIVSDERLQQMKDNIEAQREAVQLTQELADREIKLRDRQREFLSTEAELEVQISELKSKAAEKDKYTSDERIQFLTQAIALEKKLGNEKKAIAQEEYDILLEQSKLTANDAETNDKLAQAKANAIKVEAEANTKTKELIGQVSELRKSEADKAKAAADAIVAADKKKAEEEAKIRDEELKKVKEIQENIELELMDGTTREITVLTKKYEEEKALLEKYGKDTVKLTENYQNQVAKIKEEKAVSKGEGKLKDTDDETALQTFIADKTVQIEYEKNKRILEIERSGLEEKKGILEELLANDDISAEKKQEYADKLAEINASILENDRNTKVAEQEHAKELVNTYSQVAEGIGSLMSDIADFWQDNIKQREKNGEISEEQAKEEFEQTKKLQIASAIITGLAGIAAALASPVAMAMGPAGWIAAGVQAATIAVSTALQIAKIKQTTYESASSSSSSSTTTPTSTATAYTPSYSTNVTGESDTENLSNAIADKQSSTKIYVLESDIEEASKKATVRESESTF